MIGQDALQKFQKELGAAVKDPFKVVLRTSKLPLSLLDSKPVAGKEKIHILDTESYSETFSKGRRRKRPNIQLDTLDQVVEKATKEGDDYEPDNDRNGRNTLVLSRTRIQEFYPDNLFRINEIGGGRIPGFFRLIDKQVLKWPKIVHCVAYMSRIFQFGLMSDILLMFVRNSSHNQNLNLPSKLKSILLLSSV